MDNITLKRTNSEDGSFKDLVFLLDQDLKIRDGDDHAFFAQFNKVDMIRHVVVAFSSKKAVGCGAIKEYESNVWELKRMFVQPDHRGKGVASYVLKELEQWAKVLNCEKLILETGKAQPEAIGLYKKNGYTIMPNYGQYVSVTSSVCMYKVL